MKVIDPAIAKHRNTAVPAYQQIKNYVLEQIQQGIWKEGDLIPTEHALCKLFDVSRMTVNRALRELTAEQWLVRHKGSGTFVASHKLQTTLIEIGSIADEIKKRGNQHSSRVLRIGKVYANTAQAKRFSIQPNTLLYHSLIVHKENGVPVQVEDRLVNSKVAPDYLSQDWETITPNEYLMEKAPLPTGLYSLEARLPAKEIALALNMMETEPCLVMDRVTYSRKKFTTHVTMWHPGERFRYTGQV